MSHHHVCCSNLNQNLITNAIAEYCLSAKKRLNNLTSSWQRNSAPCATMFATYLPPINIAGIRIWTSCTAVHHSNAKCNRIKNVYVRGLPADQCSSARTTWNHHYHLNCLSQTLLAAIQTFYKYFWESAFEHHRSNRSSGYYQTTC